jgi:miniconductance mechanosensitive channel
MFEDLKAIEDWIPPLIGMGVLLLAAVMVNFVVRRGLLVFVHFIAARSALDWDDVLTKHSVFTRLSHIIPALVVVTGVGVVPSLPAVALTVIQNVGLAYVVLTLVLALTSGLRAANEIYETYPVARTRPLKGVVQVVQILLYIVGAVLIIATLIDRSPLILLSGLGAMTAVLLLVFKDTILGLVASVQLTANDMLRVGDWVEMPAYGADGDVLEVALHTVKVQNFDTTNPTIPTYTLISESFRNWRGMSESGGRRIKRTVQIDQSSIRFLSDDELKRLQEFALLKPHFERKRQELDSYHASLGSAGNAPINRRRLTNVGVFRAYVKSYLEHSPRIRGDMTLLVRQLAPGPQGLPIEVYCFSDTTDWLMYEDIQADLFDHILAIVPEFGLRLYQEPAGADVSGLADRLNTREINAE